MPTTITSAGITFNDNTSQTTAAGGAGSVGTTQLANNAVTAAKLGTNEQKQIAKAWVNFNGLEVFSSTNAINASTIVATSGSSTGTWNTAAAAFSTGQVGVIYYITSIGGVAGATLGGLNVATVGFQVTGFVSSTQLTIRFLAGAATSSQTITGTGTSSGFVLVGTGIRSSYNVSSVTKNGTGNYTVNFATAMADANYSVAIAGANSYVAGSVAWGQINNAASSSVSIGYQCANGAVPTIEPSIVAVAIFGN